MRFVHTLEEFIKLCKDNDWPITFATDSGYCTCEGETCYMSQRFMYRVQARFLQFDRETLTDCSKVLHTGYSPTLVDFVLSQVNEFKFKYQCEEWLKSYGLLRYFVYSYYGKWHWYEDVGVYKHNRKRRVLSGEEFTRYTEETETTLYQGNDLLIPKDDTYYDTLYGVSLPLSIIISYYTCCEEDNTIHTEDTPCPVCRDRALTYVKPYSTLAEETFSSLVGKTILLGVELELEGSSTKNILLANKLVGHHCIMKKDSSLANGIEIVSRPATIKHHKDEFKDLFYNKDLSLKAEKTCGMHIHVDRGGLTALQIGKINSFVYGNPSFINKIAERKSDFAKLVDKRDITYGFTFDDTEPIYSKSISIQGGGKYQALNLGKRRTIEFRMFASTTLYETFCKNLEFVQAIVDFTSPGAVALPLKDFNNLDPFLAFVNKNHKSYLNLHHFLNKEGN